MFSLSEMSSTMSNLLSACASLAGSLVLIRTLAREIPDPVWSYLDSGIRYLFTPNSNQQTIVIDQYCGFSFSPNQMYDAAEIHLRDKITPSTKRFKVTQSPKQKNLNVAIEKSQELFDKYENINLKWRLVTVDSRLHGGDGGEKRFFELSFHKKFKDRVVNDYLPSVLKKGEVVKLYTPSGGKPGCGGAWGSIILDHPATFDTLAMEQEMKKMIVDDLDRFVKREKYYKKAGRAWKRGYLLYGPPGTGKSSLIAAMANHLKFDVYDLELTSVRSNSELKSMLLSTTNRSIIVIEDIDCSVEMRDSKIPRYGMEMQDRKIPRYGMDPVDKELTLSGLLNFIDGLLSSCGEERIIVFTTNHKDVLDPALLRPGRMDMHIEMSYCTFQGFKQLASNYLDIQGDHRLFGQIQGLLQNVKVTPAEVAGELMKIEDPNNALDGVVKFLKRKHMKVMERKTSNVETPEAKRMKVDGCEKKSPTKGRKRGVKVGSRKQ